MMDAKMRDANNQVREASAKPGNKLSKWRPVALGQGREREIPPLLKCTEAPFRILGRLRFGNSA